MSVMSDYDLQQQEISQIVGAPGTPEQMMEERVARLVEEMIELTMLTLDPEQKPLIQQEWRGIAQVLLRAQLILGALEGADVEALRRLIVMVSDAKPAPSVVSFRR